LNNDIKPAKPPRKLWRKCSFHWWRYRYRYRCFRCCWGYGISRL